MIVLFHSLAGKPSVCREYRQWIAALDPGSPEVCSTDLVRLKRWISTMPDRQLSTMLYEMEASCRMSGIEHDWLCRIVTGSGVSGLQFYTLHLSLAYMRGSQFEPHRPVMAWMKNPDSARSREIAWQLYLKLVEAGAVNMPGDFLMAGKKRQRQVIHRSIRQVVNRDYSLVLAISRELLFLQSREKVSPGNGKSVIAGVRQHHPVRWWIRYGE
jgi:hypothetical protein